MADWNEVLERQSQKVEELQGLAETNPTAVTIQGLASIHQARGATYTSMGKAEEALADHQVAAALFAQLVLQADRADLLERMLEAHESVRADLTTLGRDAEAFDIALAESHLLVNAGHPDRALVHLRPLVRSSRQALEANPGSEPLLPYVKAQLTLGRLLDMSNQLEAALEAENAAAEAVTSFGAGDPGLLATVKMNRALTLGRIGKTEEALSEIGEVVDTYEQMVAASPANLGLLLAALERRADLLLHAEKGEAALEVMARAIDLAAPAASGPDVDSAAPLRHLLRGRSRAALQLGDYGLARADLNRAVALFQAQLATSPSFEHLLEMMETAFEAAIVSHMMGQHEQALQEANQLVETWTQMAKEAPEMVELRQRLLMARDLRERCLVELGRHEEAVADQTAIIKGYQELLRLGAPPHIQENIVHTLQRRAESNRALERHLEAASDLAEARRLSAAMAPRGVLS